LNQFFNELHKKPHYHNNLSAKDEQALKELSSNRDIMIKEADKGSGVVIMDTDHYIREGQHQLNDTLTYRRLDSDPSPQYEIELCELSKSVCRPGFQLSETDEQSQIVHQTWKR
jgi:hypothetical protein